MIDHTISQSHIFFQVTAMVLACEDEDLVLGLELVQS